MIRQSAGCQSRRPRDLAQLGDASSPEANEIESDADAQEPHQEAG